MGCSGSTGPGLSLAILGCPGGPSSKSVPGDPHGQVGWSDQSGWSNQSGRVVQVVQVIQVIQVVRVVRIICQDDMHSENLWFSWSKPSNYLEKLRCHARDRRTDERTESERRNGEQYSGRPETAI